MRLAGHSCRADRTTVMERRLLVSLQTSHACLVAEGFIPTSGVGLIWSVPLEPQALKVEPLLFLIEFLHTPMFYGGDPWYLGMQGSRT